MLFKVILACICRNLFERTHIW